MASARARKIAGDLRASRSRTVLVLLSIAIGVTAVGMVAGTLMVVWDGFSAVVTVDLAAHPVRVYAALAALVLNLAVAVAGTPLLDRMGTPRGLDRTVLPGPPTSLPAPRTSPT